MVSTVYAGRTSTSTQKIGKIGQKEVSFSTNRSKTTRAHEMIHIGYDAGHNSETGRLTSTKGLERASPPRSVPPIERRANSMFDTWPALHTVSGDFAVFLRDSIKREIIIGMTLPRVALINDVGGLDTVCETYIATTLRVDRVPSDSPLL